MSYEDAMNYEDAILIIAKELKKLKDEVDAIKKANERIDPIGEVPLLHQSEEKANLYRKEIKWLQEKNTNLALQADKTKALEMENILLRTELETYKKYTKINVLTKE